jgi:predicted SnoaL-like aldol condensation-catalyzing enzyme
MKRAVYILVFVFLAMLTWKNLRAQSGSPSGMDPMKMGGKSAIACNFEADVIFNHKIDMVDQYMTPNYIGHHNNQVDTTDMPSYKAALNKRPAGNGPERQGCGGADLVLEQGDYVTFLRYPKTPDPNDPTRMVTHTHFDIWRFQGNKIAEHWD